MTLTKSENSSYLQYRADSSHDISSAPQQPLLYNNNKKIRYLSNKITANVEQRSFCSGVLFKNAYSSSIQLRFIYNLKENICPTILVCVAI